MSIIAIKNSTDERLRFSNEDRFGTRTRSRRRKTKADVRALKQERLSESFLILRLWLEVFRRPRVAASLSNGSLLCQIRARI